jgi:3-dehydrosphinganine reductase
MNERRHVIVTGGSSGIGKATALRYFASGANVTLIARRAEILAAAAEEIRGSAGSSGNEILVLSADVADRASVSGAIADAGARFGTADVLVTSAGIVRPGYFHDLPIETFEEQMRVNYFGTLYAISAVLPAMRARGKGHIAMVSSGAGLMGIFGYTAYSPTKFALRGLAEALRGELRLDGIDLTIVYPPDTDTPQLHAENLVKPAETKLITGSAKVWSAEGVADRIVKGVEKKRFVVAPGWEMGTLGWTHSFLRPLLDRHFDRQIAKNRAKSGS